MDMKNDCRIPECGPIPNLNGLKLVVGSKQLRKALNNGTARYVLLARNADPAITEPLEVLCQLKSVSYTWVRSMQELGSACGIEVGAAAAAAIDRF